MCSHPRGPSQCAVWALASWLLSSRRRSEKHQHESPGLAASLRLLILWPAPGASRMLSVSRRRSRRWSRWIPSSGGDRCAPSPGNPSARQAALNENRQRHRPASGIPAIALRQPTPALDAQLGVAARKQRHHMSVFSIGGMTMSMGGRLAWKIGLRRTVAWWGTKNLTFSLIRYRQRFSRVNIAA
jgi:hypothetical protein